MTLSSPQVDDISVLPQAAGEDIQGLCNAIEDAKESFEDVLRHLVPIVEKVSLDFLYIW